MSGRSRRAVGIAFFTRLMRVEAPAVVSGMTAAVGERMAEETYEAVAGAWEGGPLSPRDRSLVVIASLVALGGLDAKLPAHLRLAIDNGVTPAELEAMFVTLAVYVGFPRASAASEVLRVELGAPISGPAPPG